MAAQFAAQSAAAVDVGCVRVVKQAVDSISAVVAVGRAVVAIASRVGAGGSETLAGSGPHFDSGPYPASASAAASCSSVPVVGSEVVVGFCLPAWTGFRRYLLAFGGISAHKSSLQGLARWLLYNIIEDIALT